jgi:tRNA threonylcarbamoyl adenosine modification protein YjeE
MSADETTWPRTISLPGESDTARLGAVLAVQLRAGDTITLSGGLGAGKTSLARAIITALAGRAIEVQSPTFTLVQTYTELPVAVAHYDLYRLTDARELDELGFEDGAETVIRLVEWPERAEASMPDNALSIELKVAGTGRIAVFEGKAPWPERLTGIGSAAD